MIETFWIVLSNESRDGLEIWNRFEIDSVLDLGSSSASSLQIGGLDSKLSSLFDVFIIFFFLFFGGGMVLIRFFDKISIDTDEEVQ